MDFYIIKDIVVKCECGFGLVFFGGNSKVFLNIFIIDDLSLIDVLFFLL